MEFYTSISKYYDHIFPFEPAHISFINHFIQPSSDKSILDTGCGTGSLSVELARLGYQVYGIDNDGMMIDAALVKKKAVPGKYPVFEKMDMRFLSSRFGNNFFDAVICFGNTLVHLANAGEISAFIKSLKPLLKQKGFLLIQILNYNYILDNKIDKLPPIENDVIIFERRYEYPEQNNIVFYTKLTVKREGTFVENRIKLYPVTKEDMESMLAEAGFKEIEFYGNFKREPLKDDSLPLVIKCSRA